MVFIYYHPTSFQKFIFKGFENIARENTKILKWYSQVAQVVIIPN
jgi:hypothetical protein